MKIAVAGIGYVGLANALALARVCPVSILDMVEEKVRLINQRISPLADSGIKQALTNDALDLVATCDPREAYSDVDFVIIATSTDYDVKNNRLNTASVESVYNAVRAVNSRATIVIKSTVSVGFAQTLSDQTGDTRLLSSPEFLREGQALHDCLHPSRIIVGAVRDGSSEVAQSFASLMKQACAHDITADDLPCLIMHSTEAEATKLFSNAYLALRIAFFNELDTYAEVRNLDTRQIIEGIGHDARIGNYYNNPSFGYGGYCLPKDTKQLLANYDNVPQNIMRAIVEANDTRKDYIAQRAIALAESKAEAGKGSENETENTAKPIIGIYRLTMKSHSDNFRHSSIRGVMRRIREQGYQVFVYEPMIDEDAFEEYPVIHDLAEFKRTCTVILANRASLDLGDCLEKVYTRDLYARD